MNRPTRNAVFLLGGEVGSRVFGFLVSAYLARVLGVDGFGQIGFAVAIFGYATMATKFGLLTVGIKDVAQDRSRVQELTGNIIALRLLLSLAAAVVMVVLGFILQKRPTVTGLLLVFAVGVVVQSLLLEWVFTGTEKTAYISVARTAASAVYFCLALVLVRSPESVMLVAVAFVAATAVGTVVLLVAYSQLYGQFSPHLDSSVARSLIHRAWPVGIASLLTQVHASAGIVALSFIRGDAAAGAYTAAHRVVFFVLMLDRIFQTVFFPLMSRYVKERSGRLRWLTGAALRMLLAVGLPMCSGLMLLSSPAINMVFGTEYRTSIPLLAILSWFVLLSLLTSLAGYSLLASGQERRFARNTAIGVGASLCLVVIAVVRWGATGAAVGIVTGEAILLLLMGIDFLRIAPPSVDWRTLVPVLACVPLVLILLLLRQWNWPLAALSGACAYLAVLFLGKGVALSDIGLMRRHD